MLELADSGDPFYDERSEAPSGGPASDQTRQIERLMNRGPAPPTARAPAPCSPPATKEKLRVQNVQLELENSKLVAALDEGRRDVKSELARSKSVAKVCSSLSLVFCLALLLL